MPFVVPEPDPARSWNPLNTFWKVFYPLVNPRPDASPTQLNAPPPIWDIPSPYGGVHHPEVKDGIPYYVHPDYYTKLILPPKFEVVHYQPPFWMTVMNFGLADLAKVPAATATAPAFVWFYSTYARAPKPTPFTWFAATMIGLSGAFVSAYMNSENRLQGFMPNEKDVVYWKQRAEYQRKVLSGEIDPRNAELTFSQQTLYWLFGPKPIDNQKVEQEYLGENALAKE